MSQWLRHRLNRLTRLYALYVYTVVMFILVVFIPLLYYGVYNVVSLRDGNSILNIESDIGKYLHR